MNLFYRSDLQSKQVGTAGFEASNDPQAVLVSGWLGAGLGLTAYDPEARVAGLIHAPLPDSSVDVISSRARPALFIDTGLGALLEAMARLGAETGRLQICLAGGAQLGDRGAESVPGRDVFPAAIRALARHHLKPQIQNPTSVADSSCSLEVATGEVRMNFSGQTRVTVLWKNLTAT